MKSFLAAVGCIMLVLMIFAGGIAVGRMLLPGESAARPPLDIETDTDVWTSEPRRVDTAAQDFERLPARDVPSDLNTDGEVQAAEADAADDEAPIDRTSTASIQPDDDAITAFDEAVRQPPDAATPPGASAGTVAAHREWCFSRYRSYRPENDSYTSYSGESRRCVSPYSDALAQADGGTPPPTGDPEVSSGGINEASATTAEYGAGATGAGIRMSAEHIEDCFSRYRTYRPEDNSYQPYGGGSRKQCL